MIARLKVLAWMHGLFAGSTTKRGSVSTRVLGCCVLLALRCETSNLELGELSCQCVVLCYGGVKASPEGEC
jgi:hypothetical protein